MTDGTEANGEYDSSTGPGNQRKPRTAPDSAIQEDTATDTPTKQTERPPANIELDEVFGVLKNQRRRDVLRHLTENDTEIQLGELAEEIAARETGKDVSQINSQERKRVYVGLYQCHLPKLADVDVIDYNKPRGTIERGPTFDYISRYLPPDESPTDAENHDRTLVDSLSTIVSSGRKLI